MEIKRKPRCCFCIPQDWGIKLWYLWAVYPMISLIGGFVMDSRNMTPMLPNIAVTWIMMILLAVVFWHPGFDNYGTRMAVFWTWVNGWGFANLYFYFLNTNSFWWNIHHFLCFDNTGSLYSQDYIDCIANKGSTDSMLLGIGLLFDIWGAIEFYRWA